MLSFVIAEEDLWIETSYPFNEVTAVFLLNNPCYHHTYTMHNLNLETARGSITMIAEPMTSWAMAMSNSQSHRSVYALYTEGLPTYTHAKDPTRD